MNNLLRYIWFEILIKPLVLIILGLNVHERQKIFKYKQMIIVANHNSHLDTMVLLTLFPFKRLKKIRPVAAIDYFLQNRFLHWFSKNIIQIVPISRQMKSIKKAPLSGCVNAIEQEYSLILYPEGSRGQPEKLNDFKTGIAHLAKMYPEIAIVPVFCHGLGKALPKGEFLLVPFYCDIFVGDAIFWSGERNEFMKNLNQSMYQLAQHGNFTPWD